MEYVVRDMIYGTNARTVKLVNIYECGLGDNAFVDPFVGTQKGCVIGSESRIQSYTSIRENVALGESCFIGHNATSINDLFRPGTPGPSPDNWINITPGDSVTVGSGVIILSPYIRNRAVTGTDSVVVKSIENKDTYAGDPARLLRIL